MMNQTKICLSETANLKHWIFYKEGGHPVEPTTVGTYIRCKMDEIEFGDYNCEKTELIDCSASQIWIWLLGILLGLFLVFWLAKMAVAVAMARARAPRNKEQLGEMGPLCDDEPTGA